MLDRDRSPDGALEQVAQRFVAARNQAHALVGYPGDLPSSLAEAYAIQDHAIRIDGRPVGGWKVGRVNPPHADMLGTTRLAGPIFADTIVAADPAAPVAMPVYAGGFAAVEAEMLIEVAAAVPANVAQLDDAAIMALIRSVHVGLEIASSPFPGINALGPVVTASDFGNNAGLVVGEELPDWRNRDLAALHAALSIDGVEQGQGDMLGLPGGPLESVRFLLGNLAARGLLPDHPVWISAGAISGVHEIAPGSTAHAVFDGTMTVRCEIVVAQPQG